MIPSSIVMEGSTLSFHDTEMLITQNITPEAKPPEHFLMTSNHYAALLKVNELAKDTKLKLPHTLIKDVADAVMRRTGDKVNTPLGTPCRNIHPAWPRLHVEPSRMPSQKVLKLTSDHGRVT